MKKRINHINRICESPPLGGFRGQIKVFAFLFSISILTACKDQAYLHHKLKFEKVADNCSGGQQSFQMNSNINGERYEFNKCLSENFAKENVTYARQGDTVVVHFQNANPNVKQSEFHITLDIDTYPRYNFLTIDGDTFIIVPTSG
ncbi:MAG: hypothetical protein ACHQEB_05175 [Chitinophagales bacterium]